MKEKFGKGEIVKIENLSDLVLKTGMNVSRCINIYNPIYDVHVRNWCASFNFPGFETENQHEMLCRIFSKFVCQLFDFVAF